VEVEMKASALDLRYRMSEISKALDRRESVSLPAGQGSRLEDLPAVSGMIPEEPGVA
jgi:hypothetical protein